LLKTYLTIQMNLIRIIGLYIMITNILNPANDRRRSFVTDMIAIGTTLQLFHINMADRAEKNATVVEEKHHTYEDEVSTGGMVSGSWSTGGTSSAYECSGIAGATDC
jgi:hypothetical protein